MRVLVEFQLDQPRPGAARPSLAQAWMGAVPTMGDEVELGGVVFHVLDVRHLPIVVGSPEEGSRRVEVRVTLGPGSL